MDLGIISECKINCEQSELSDGSKLSAQTKDLLGGLAEGYVETPIFLSYFSCGVVH